MGAIRQVPSLTGAQTGAVAMRMTGAVLRRGLASFITICNWVLPYGIPYGFIMEFHMDLYMAVHGCGL